MSNADHPLSGVGDEDDGLEGTLRLILKTLPHAVVVDARPRDGRPSIIELPVEATHAVGSGCSLSPYAKGNTSPLHHLREIDEVLEVSGLGIVLTDVVKDHIIADATLLMSLHHCTLQIVVFGQGEALDTREHREGLHPKLAHEARHAFP